MENSFSQTRVRIIHSEGKKLFYCFAKTALFSERTLDSLLCFSLEGERCVSSDHILDMGNSEEKNRRFFEEFSRTVSPPYVLKELFEEYIAAE